MHERAFVLAPAAEIAADWHHPLRNKTIRELLAALPSQQCAVNGMRVFISARDAQLEIMRLRTERRSLGLVPTMGALHDGHLSLVRLAREQSDIVVASIFVNPTQFAPHEDLGQYPRNLDADLQALAAAQCDIVLAPSAAEMYPAGFSTYVEPPAVAAPLEGACRPGHFRGVATVVLKLFHLVPADRAYFGQKDYQQLLVIRHMVRDLAVPVEIVPCPIVREADGLAMSSRNRYLSPHQRQQARALSRALDAAERLVKSGERDARRIVGQMRDALAGAGMERIDYVVLADPESLVEKSSLDGPAVALIAAHVGNTRLIDNRLLNT